MERLRDSSGLALSLVAEEGGRMAGHIAMSAAAIGKDREGWFLLGPVGVLPLEQGKGIGSALVREALLRLQGQGATGVVLVGDPAFYARFGFASAPGLTWGDVPGEYILALPFTGGVPAGEVEHHPAFGA